MSNEIKTQVVVLGSGPGGYSAAFRAADLGLDVVLIEKYSNLGGVCLNVGCIPSKALLHVAKVIDDAKDMAAHGVTFGQPEIDLEKIRQWKDSEVVGKLTQGVGGMAKMRKVKVVNGYGKFTGANSIEVEGTDGNTTVNFDNAIIACGSSVVNLPFIPEDDRIIDSTGALELKDVPEEMLVLGGGIIGLEMGTVYSSLGANVSVVEFADQLVPAADADVVKIYTKHNKPRFKSIMLSTKVVAVDAKEDGLYVTFEGKKAPEGQVRFDKILVAVGRKPNGHLIAADKAGVNVDERGFINVSNELRTNVPHIFAIGDVVGQPMLAHKAVHEAHVAAEVIAGKKHVFEPRCIPSIAYTDPEIAWVGVTEREAKEQGLNIEVANFPWSASGRAIASARTEGKTKMIFDKDTGRVLGGAIVGINAGEMLGEIGLAVEMGADAEDVGLTIHAHPTLNESVGLAAEVFEGSITDLPNAKAVKKKKK
ncbi:dihydrolipoyl dehydrogenase [Thalassotalea sp. HSM 43]|uniref:dihydrolipoyl dehydrogenase n=1 Tax=Thalassotalea sp. HSM 43 TaxID=2552945 RepID=UPI00108012DA|nr:dihydrolipoyl dehydrogenase [Thalassotalea sp. HSM 43]QBY04848.1 dihydrolipoyl dehydrogenase [Thalassotalea sp. HSM 43]